MISDALERDVADAIAAKIRLWEITTVYGKHGVDIALIGTRKLAGRMPESVPIGLIEVKRPWNADRYSGGNPWYRLYTAIGQLMYHGRTRDSHLPLAFATLADHIEAGQPFLADEPTDAQVRAHLQVLGIGLILCWRNGEGDGVYMESGVEDFIIRTAAYSATLPLHT